MFLQLAIRCMLIKSLLPLPILYFFCPLPHRTTWTFSSSAGWLWRIPPETVRMSWGSNGNSETWVGVVESEVLLPMVAYFGLQGIQWQASNCFSKGEQLFGRIGFETVHGLVLCFWWRLSMVPQEVSFHPFRQHWIFLVTVQSGPVAGHLLFGLYSKLVPYSFSKWVRRTQSNVYCAREYKLPYLLCSNKKFQMQQIIFHFWERITGFQKACLWWQVHEFFWGSSLNLWEYL